MSPLHDESPAFRQALLKSERLRILILFFAIGVASLFRVIRTLVAWTPENARDLLWLGVCLAVLVVIELFVLRAIGPAIKSADSLSKPYWRFNILLETCFPAVVIAFVSSSTIAPELRALVNPAFLLYFLLITLSTLRLNPVVSILCGVFSAVTYLLAAIYHGWSPHWIFTDVSLFAPQKIVSAYVASILVLV